MGSSHSYRPDIDGLRALAVLAVLVYHAFPAAAPGGFAGVDVFFVISGFLISSIIFGGLRQGSFSFADFYWRRVRRLFPALILVLAFSLAFGSLVLLPDEFRALGTHVLAGAGFLSNIVLWREVGYFDGAAELKPLLHLWSLGVEEQYYIVWPLLLFVFSRRPRLLPAMIVAVAVGSFAANLWMTATLQSAAFYLPFARFWELMAGSALAYRQHYCVGGARLSNAKALTGLALLALSLVLLHPQRAFPGGWALLPVLGTALLVAAGPGAWINRVLLAQPAMVFLGLISYPLYLWHWPLLSFARMVEGGEPPATVRLALLALSLLLAWLTYTLVERKVRFAERPRLKRAAVPALAASMAAVGFAGLLALQGRLVPQSASVPLLAEISRAASDWGYDRDRVIRGDTDKAVLFFGDSHMQHYWPRIEKIAAERAAPVRTVIFKTRGGCAPIPGIERWAEKFRTCGRFIDEGVELALQPWVETVIIAASWFGALKRAGIAAHQEGIWDGLEDTLRQLAQSGKRVVLVLSTPRGEAFDPKSFVRRAGFSVELHRPFVPIPRSQASAATSSIDARLRTIAAAVGAAVIDPADLLCTPSHCPTADELGRPLFMDGRHLRASAARERFSALDQYVYLR
jgi:peptidoglycan/LPS O-acetylase OafA/YrhL